MHLFLRSIVMLLSVIVYPDLETRYQSDKTNDPGFLCVDYIDNKFTTQHRLWILSFHRNSMFQTARKALPAIK